MSDDNGHEIETRNLRPPRASLAVPVLEGIKEVFDTNEDGEHVMSYKVLVQSPIYDDVLAFLADTVEDTTPEWWDRQHPIVTMRALNQCVKLYREGAQFAERLEYSKNY